MSDDQKASPPANAPTAPEIIVRGGTTSARYDQEMARRRLDAERRRRLEDRRHVQARAGAQMTPEGFTVARIGQRGISTESPRLVLNYLNKDKTIRQQAIGEITQLAMPSGELATMFTMVCPACVSRGVPQAEAQMMINDKHRKFYLDERKRGPVRLDTPDGPLVVIICGTVSVDDRIRCNNVNCGYSCRINDSNVYED